MSDIKMPLPLYTDMPRIMNPTEHQFLVMPNFRIESKRDNKVTKSA